VADEQLGGDLGIRPALRDQAQHIAFAIGKRLQPPVLARGGRVDEPFDESAGDRGGEQGLAGVHGAHCGGELLGRDGLEQESARACPKGRVDVLVHVEGGQDQHSAAGSGCGDQPSGLDAVQLRHPDVDQRDVRIQVAHQPDGVESGAALADDL
jgi:hypothetical protein